MEYSANGRGVESGVPFHLKIVRLAGHMGSIPKFPRIFLQRRLIFIFNVYFQTPISYIPTNEKNIVRGFCV